MAIYGRKHLVARPRFEGVARHDDDRTVTAKIVDYAGALKLVGVVVTGSVEPARLEVGAVGARDRKRVKLRLHHGSELHAHREAAGESIAVATAERIWPLRVERPHARRYRSPVGRKQDRMLQRSGGAWQRIDTAQHVE